VREVDTADRRVFRVKLTPEGQRQFQRMAAEHEQWVVDLFGALSQKQKKQLVDLLGELKAHISATTPGGG
jgi:DNA-binding MarR family transcriptional regulator